MVHLTLPTFAVASAFCSLALLFSSAEAHTALRIPEICYNQPLLKKMRKRTMDPIQFLEKVKNFTVEKSFPPWLEKEGFTSLRAFLDDETRYQVLPGVDFKNGWTIDCPSPQPIPKDGIVHTSGYLHKGMCELYIDNKLVSSAKDCHETFPEATQCVDFSSCNGTCVLSWYWLAERVLKRKPSWQVYKARVFLTTGGKPVDKPTCTPIGASPQ
ncbi:unnamed protein product [Peronospora destructor]|uniref:Uncharacterized protein n=1 Tax=Peronospora destructor TaxID=86335 RepID=A0AAV0V2I3_9STRA|nr:unnamed protein product [Peronospora destructor]